MAHDEDDHYWVHAGDGTSMRIRRTSDLDKELYGVPVGDEAEHEAAAQFEWPITGAPISDEGCLSDMPWDGDGNDGLLPKEASERKATPICTGVLDYFPLALAEVARVSRVGNEQHNPGEPLHWAREKSTDHPDCVLRHLVDRGKIDKDGMRHSAKLAWRALALLETELENTLD